MRLIAVCLIAGISVVGCNRHCDDADFVPKLQVMEDYFGMYRSGAWWVYYNQDTTKIDSVYVYNFAETTPVYESQCIRATKRSFALKATFLTSAEHLIGLYDNNGGDRHSNLFQLISPQRIDVFNFYSSEGRDSVIVTPSMPSTTRVYNYQVLPNTPTLQVPEATLVRNIDGTLNMVLAPKFGIFQFIKHSGSGQLDTFTLAKFQTP